MWARDPKDRRYRERLSASYLASLILHLLMALLLFTLASSSSQEGASESEQGGEVVTIEQRAPIQPQTVQIAKASTAKVVPVAHTAPQPVPPSAAPPVPHAPIAPRVQHAPIPRPASQRWQLQHQELAKITPNGSPNPPPVPKAPIQPLPEPTEPVFEPSPLPQNPVAPISVNTPTPITVSVRNPPTSAPSPMPTVAPRPVPTHAPATPRPAPSATPRPAPTAQPQPAATARTVVATSAPASPAPKATAVVANVRASAAPKGASALATTAPHVKVSGGSNVPAPSAKTAGVPSPGPTRGPSIATSGTHASPGPKGQSSPGSHAGSNSANRPGPVRPIKVQPHNNPGTSNVGNVGKPTAAQLNAKLRALLPTGSVTPTSKSYGGGAANLHPQLVPTPPPDVVARTKFIYQSTDTSGEGERLVKMWVTSIARFGPITFCTGWLVRYPAPPPMSGTASGVQSLLSILIGGTPPRTIVSSGSAGQNPVIEQNASYVCPAHSLTPFKP